MLKMFVTLNSVLRGSSLPAMRIPSFRGTRRWNHPPLATAPRHSWVGKKVPGKLFENVRNCFRTRESPTTPTSSGGERRLGRLRHGTADPRARSHIVLRETSANLKILRDRHDWLDALLTFGPRSSFALLACRALLAFCCRIRLTERNTLL